MGTSWSEVICNYAMPVIDDVRLTDQMGENPALFLRRMSLYMDLAIPMLSRPPSLDAILKEGLEKPDYGDVTWISTQESTQQVTIINTGMIGYELFSCSLRTSDDAGVITAKPIANVTYDSETGEVTFPVQQSANLEYSLDFYTDGSFGVDLTEAQKRLLGLCIGIVWDERFSRSWLNIQVKIKDSSFDTVNESNYMREVTSRLKTNRHLLNDELRRYEQDMAYVNAIPPNPPLRFV